MASVVKASFKGIMKRLTYGTEGAKFDGLVKTLKESFAIAEGAKLRILYTDSDGDKVLLSDNEDLRDALNNQKLNPLYLEVTIIEEVKAEAKTEAKTAGGPTDPLAALFGNMNNWTSGEGKERFDKFASSFKQGQDVFESIMKDINPSTAAGSSDIMEKILSGVSAAAAAATNAANAASSSKAQEATTKEEAKPAPVEKTDKTEEKADKTEKKAEKEPEKTTEKEDSEEKVNESVHPGVQCDVCSMVPIKGTRYKSLDQHDYDLCQACMDTYTNKTEQFTRIEHPLYRPRGHFGPGFRGGRGGPRCMPPGLQFGGRPFTCGNMNPSNNRWGGRHWGPPGAVEAKPDARFVKDVTIYDGTEMVPGTPFTKIWRFRNVGTTAWPQGTRIVKVGGDSLSEQEAFELQISENGLAPGEEVDVAANLTAPEKPGRYVTHFRLATPQGVRFGHRMWALIHVLDKDEESPLVADSKAEDATPSAPDVPAPEKEPVEETSDEVKVIPVEGADVTPEEGVVVTPESPKTEPTNLGDDGFMKVEQADTKSPEDSSPEETVIQAPAPTPPAADAPKTADTASPEKALSAAEDASAEQVVPESVVEDKAPEGELYKEQLAKLAELGFADGAQNVALLEKYGGDLPKTINDLVTVNEWDPMLQELEEMGFYDKELNRSLIYKNNGRLQRVVKDLVQIYKAGPSA